MSLTSKYAPKPVKKVKQAPAAPKVIPKVDTKVQEKMMDVQIAATKALTDAASAAMDSSRMEEILRLLAQPATQQPEVNKRLVINRDRNGLIETIDIDVI